MRCSPPASRPRSPPRSPEPNCGSTPTPATAPTGNDPTRSPPPSTPSSVPPDPRTGTELAMSRTLATEHVTAADGARIAFWTSGDGPPLVMVHGSMADHTTLAGVVPLLEPHFTVHA